MSLEPQQFGQLHEALIRAFTEEDLRLLAKIELGINLDEVVAKGSLRTRLFELIEWVEQTGRTVDLIRGAYKGNPLNRDLQVLARDALQWHDCMQAGPALFITDDFAPRQAEDAYLAQLLEEHKKWLGWYTPLRGEAEVQMQSSGTKLALDDPFMDMLFEKLEEHGFGPERRIARVAVEDLREAVARYKRLVILGEPGSGKTTTLRRLVYDYVVAAQHDPSAPIPVLVPLGGYNGTESALHYAAQHAGPLGFHLPAYLREGRVILLLDALNEMPREGYKERVERIQALLDAFKDASVIVTCRELDYVEALNLEKLQVKSLDPLRQHAFLCRYLGEGRGDALFWQMAGKDVANFWLDQQSAGMDIEQFWSSDRIISKLRYPAMPVVQTQLRDLLHGSHLPPLLALGANPFFLLMFAQVYASRGSLPQNRAKLSAAFVEALLERERLRHPETWPGVDTLMNSYANLAFEMQRSSRRGTVVSWNWAAQRLAILGIDAHEALYLGRSANLLNPSDHGVSFSHQLIQEYFAATAWRALISQDCSQEQYWPANWSKLTGWEETAILLAGLLPDITAFVESVAAIDPQLAARCIAESGGVRPAKAVIDNVQRTLAAKAVSTAESIWERNAAANALNFLGDERDGVGVHEDGTPAIAWCRVPAGAFSMGNRVVVLRGIWGKSTKEAHFYHLDNSENLTVRLDEFVIGKYPVTQAQFQIFVNDGGYTDKWKHCWPFLGWKWKESHRHTGPERFDNLFNLANHPVVGVSWYEAVAFCNWLAQKLHQPVRLPTEQQWEKAARGKDRRKYPWGSEDAMTYANYLDTGVLATTAVGIFPKGESPYGLLDMAGNVREWTTTTLRLSKLRSSGRSYVPDDTMDSLRSRIVRGGSWAGAAADLLCMRRQLCAPYVRQADIGFRVVSSIIATTDNESPSTAEEAVLHNSPPRKLMKRRTRDERSVPEPKYH